MKKNIILLQVVLCIGSALSAHNDYATKTYLVHKEMATHNNPNLTQETHPVIYALIQDLVTKAGIDMPRYITLYDAQYTIIHNGLVYRGVHDIKAYIDLLGDLHICREILTTLSYEDIQGVLSIAVAEIAIHKPLQVAAFAGGSFGVNALASYFRNKYLYRYSRYQEPPLISLVPVAMAKSLLMTYIFANYLQKKVDIQAATLVDNKSVIQGIQGLTKVTDRYRKENVLLRIASACNLKKIFNIVFYPVRPYTAEERIAYLEDAVDK